METQEKQPSPKQGRNDPCACGSGKKYKRCCAMNEVVESIPSPSSSAAPSLPEGFDPSSLDMEWMLKLTQAMQRLPRGQMQRLQGFLQKAMAGKDLGREGADFEKTLPVELQQLLQSAPQLGAPGDQTQQGDLPSQNVGQPPKEATPEQKSAASKMWSKLFKRKG